MEVLSQQVEVRKEERPRDNEALIFSSRHLAVRKGKGQLVVGGSLKAEPTDSFGPRVAQGLCTPGKDLDYMTFKFLSILKYLLFKDSLLDKFSGSAFIFTE